MYLKNFSNDEFSICKKDTCITAKGSQARIIGTVVTVAVIVLSIASLLRSN